MKNCFYLKTNRNFCLKWIPFCDLDWSDPTHIKLKFSLESEVLQQLERHVQFKANLIDANGNWGINVNGTWSGAIGQIYYGVN